MIISKLSIIKRIKRRSKFNYKNEQFGIYCKKHSLQNMIDIKTPKCIECKVKQPIFNYENETKRLYCSNCAKPNMIDSTH